MPTSPELDATLPDPPGDDGAPRDLAAALLGGAGSLLSAADFADDEPLTIDRYRIQRLIGEGAAGRVYLAQDPKLGRKVAIKLLEHGRPRELERFRREVALLGALDHPGIVTVYDAGEHDGRPFYAMEYARGSSLDQAVGDNRLPLREAAELIRRVARACHAAHSKGVVHRDLKPQNILLRGGPRRPTGTLHGRRPMIADFGVARLVSSDLTQTGQVLGTPHYMAPEQARGEDVDPRTDVYALGVILYQLLTGALPFDDETLVGLVDAICRRDVVRPRALIPDLPRPLERIVLQAMARRPDRRYETARALADDLDAWLAGEPVRARGGTRPHDPLLRAVRHPLVAASLGAAAIALVVALRDPTPPPTPTTTNAGNASTTDDSTPADGSGAAPTTDRDRQRAVFDQLLALERWERGLYRRGEPPRRPPLQTIARALEQHTAAGLTDDMRHQALAGLGRARMHLGDRAAGRAALEAAARIGGPRSADCHYDLARDDWDLVMREILRRREQSATAAMARAAQRLADARAALPDGDPRAPLVDALTLLCRDPRDQAKATLQALESVRTSGGAVGEQAATLAGGVLLVVGECERAKAVYGWVVERRPHDGEALRGLALAYLLDRTGLPSIRRAFDLTERAIARQPGHEASYFPFVLLVERLFGAGARPEKQLGGLGIALVERVLAGLEDGARRLPTSARLRRARALAWILSAYQRYLAKRAPAETLAQATALLTTETRAAPSVEAYLGLGIARLLEAVSAGRGDAMTDSAEAFDHAATIDPQDPRPWLWLGTQRRAAGNPAGAVAAWDRAIALRPQSRAELASAIARELASLGDRQVGSDVAAAIRSWERAIDLDASQRGRLAQRLASALRVHGYRERKAGRRAEAIAAWERAIALVPAYARYLRDDLASLRSGG